MRAACSDAVTLFIQCAGGGLLAMINPAVVNIGAKIELAGLILQLCFFAIFACITIHIHNSHRFGLSQRPGSRLMFGCLYASMILLTIRNVYRAVEFAQGFQGESTSLDISGQPGTLISTCTAIVQHLKVEHSHVQGTWRGMRSFFYVFDTVSTEYIAVK